MAVVSAPEPVVRAVMDDGCDPFAAIDGLRCARHRFARVQDRGCPIAVDAADAAFAASMGWAAERWEQAAKVLEDQEHSPDLADECLPKRRHSAPLGEGRPMTRQQRDSRILTWLCVVMAVAVVVALIVTE